MIMCIFGLILTLRFQDIEQKPNSDINEVLFKLCCISLYNPKVHTVVLVNDNVYTKFGHIQSNHSQDVEQKQNYENERISE